MCIDLYRNPLFIPQISRPEIYSTTENGTTTTSQPFMRGLNLANPIHFRLAHPIVKLHLAIFFTQKIYCKGQKFRAEPCWKLWVSQKRSKYIRVKGIWTENQNLLICSLKLGLCLRALKRDREPKCIGPDKIPEKMSPGYLSVDRSA